MNGYFRCLVSYLETTFLFLFYSQVSRLFPFSNPSYITRFFIYWFTRFTFCFVLQFTQFPFCFGKLFLCILQFLIGRITVCAGGIIRVLPEWPGWAKYLLKKREGGLPLFVLQCGRNCPKLSRLLDMQKYFCNSNYFRVSSLSVIKSICQRHHAHLSKQTSTSMRFYAILPKYYGDIWHWWLIFRRN